MALSLHPKRNCALGLVAVVATTFPRWQVSVTVPPKAVKHFSKDMEIAKTAEEGTAGQELTLEIGLLVKGTVPIGFFAYRVSILCKFLVRSTDFFF